MCVCVVVCVCGSVCVCVVQLWLYEKPHDSLMTECHVTITSTGLILSTLSAAAACVRVGVYVG